MRNLWISVLVLAVAACGGGGQGMPPPVPFGTISGSTFDALIVGGTVRAYDFSNGTKGDLLGQAVSDANGLYSVSVQLESQPILLEVTGGRYIEEAGAKAQVSLAPAHKLSAIVNYITGSTTRACLTTYTHLAAGLATFEASLGMKAADAVDDANRRVSALAGVDILATIPASITDAGSANSVVTPELQYGMLSGAISQWTYDHIPSTSTQPHLLPYTSIDFAQLVYQDIVADGLLDGIGLDEAGNKTQLSFGTIPLGPDSYRFGLGVSMLKMAGDKNNLTGIDGAAMLSTAKAYVGNTDLMFAGIAPVSLTPPIASITTPAANVRVSGTLGVAASEQSIVGLSKAELLVDGVVARTLTTNLSAPTFQLDTTAYTDGNRSLAIRVTDYGGQSAISSVQVLVVNVAPAVTISSPIANSTLNGTITVSANLASVAGLASVELQLDGITIATSTNFSTPSFSVNTASYADGPHTLSVKVIDIGGLVSIGSVNETFANYPPVVSFTSPAANTWVRGTITVTSTVQSGVGLSSVVQMLDGGMMPAPATPTAPALQLDTTTISDGAHTVTVSATDVDGLVTTNSLPLKFDNTAPTTTFTVTPVGGSPATQANGSGCATDGSGSGIQSVFDVTSNTNLTLSAQGCWSITHAVSATQKNWPIIVKDRLGNCTTYSWDVWNLPSPFWAVASTGICP